MTAYTKSVSGSLRFVSGQALYPGASVFPAPDQWPNPGVLVFAAARNLSGALVFAGGVSSSAAHTQLLTAVLHPVGAFTRRTTRALAGAALSFAGSLAKQQSIHVFSKLVTASLRAAGHLTVARVLPPSQGGGGFATPMGEEFFKRYKPTLRRQRMRV